MSGVSSKRFGGDWSDEKLAALGAYLTSYGQALSKAPFERIYIDAFAGAGIRKEVQGSDEDLFTEMLPEEDAGYRHGSPLIALGIEPSFQRFVFIEQDAGSLGKLQAQVAKNFPGKLGISDFLHGDANDILQGLAGESWKTRRAVAFLDPFALHVKWKTIELIARTQAIDMWLLFPAMAVNRMLPKSGVVPEKWASKLTSTFGSAEWKDYFYETEQDMFGEETVTKLPKVFEKLSDFITMRLGTVFEKANTKPLVLRNSTGAPLFLLCFASGNPRGAPIAVRIANHIINKKNHGH